MSRFPEILMFRVTLLRVNQLLATHQYLNNQNVRLIVTDLVTSATVPLAVFYGLPSLSWMYS